MEFKFKNLGLIKEANIELNGLTVITGYNDTGKSFLSKAIFSVIKTIRESANESSYYKIDILEQETRHLSVFFRQVAASEVRFTQFKNQVINYVVQKLPYSIISDYIDLQKRDLLSNIDLKISISEAESLFERLKDRILAISKTDEKIFESYFDSAIIQQLFRSQINSKIIEDDLYINCKEGELDVVKAQIRNNKTLSFTADSSIYYQDVTLIDSPLIIQLAYFIRQQRVRYTRRSSDSGLPFYYLDLVYKLPYLKSKALPEYSGILSDIQNIIGGEMIYKDKTDSFIFRKPNAIEIETNNIATGIKSFGVIQLLINSGVINSRSVLIIDEPEVHLHPKWEIEYAKVIVALVKANIPVVVSSHSPYLIRALIELSKTNGINDKTKLYFGEKDSTDNSVVFKDVSNDLNKVFAALSEPFRQFLINS